MIPNFPPVGVIPLDGQTARFRVWAPKAKRVELVLGAGDRPDASRWSPSRAASSA